MKALPIAHTLVATQESRIHTPLIIPMLLTLARAHTHTHTHTHTHIHTHTHHNEAAPAEYVKRIEGVVGGDTHTHTQTR
jgi:hypothetical protein